MKRIVFLLAVFFSANLYGQPMMGGMRDGRKAMEMISAIRIVKMQKALNLTDQQLASIIPKLNERDSMMRKYFDDQASDLKLLRDELAKSKPAEAKLKEIIERMKSREQNHEARVRELRNEILAVLSTEQQARFIIFEVEFEREIRRLIDQVRGRDDR